MSAPEIPARIHVQLTRKAREDLRAVAELIEGSQSWSVSSAIRCFRACLEAGLVAESGELLAGSGSAGRVLALPAPLPVNGAAEKISTAATGARGSTAT